MRVVFCLLAILPLSAGEDPHIGRDAALASARRGHWRAAESQQRAALAACRACTAEELAVLRAELAGYLTLGGFPEAAIPLWKQSLSELPQQSRLRATSLLGLGVAYQDAGRGADAKRAWEQACKAPLLDAIETAACRFNIAVARMDTAIVWSEMEEILPTLLTANGAISRATALLQTARAAALAGQGPRAAQLLDQADAVIVWELDPKHPFRAFVYHAQAQLAEKQGNGKEASAWRKKAAKVPEQKGWDRGTVSLEELRRGPH